jgi:murein L,D-transpeptidase YafK
MFRCTLLSLFVLGLLISSASAGAMSFLPQYLARTPPTAETEDEQEAIAALFADKVLVKKSERRLYLMRKGRPFLSYPISLGFEPEGHKEREGDGRTPEGRYVLDWRNPTSRFYKSLHISYPNFGDRLRAERRGHKPGGMIMIHGQPPPNEHAELQQIVSGEDWTRGCIAVPNYAIDEIWEYTAEGTVIDILP